MAMKNYVAYNVSTPKTATIKILVYVGFQKQTLKRINLLCVINVAVEDVPVLIEFLLGYLIFNKVILYGKS